MYRTLSPARLAIAALLCAAPHALAIDSDHQTLGLDAAKKGVDYLVAKQDQAGTWLAEIQTPNGAVPNPATIGITGLALTALLDHPGIGATHPASQKAIEVLIAAQREDGAISGDNYAVYNTSIAVSALSRLKDNEKAQQAVQKGVEWLKSKQWADGMTDPQGNKIDKDHPYYGGFGYGKHGRPDMSNTQFTLQALHDAGVNASDPAFERAKAFLQANQGIPENPKVASGEIAADGGHIYATSINKDHIDTPQSMANPDQTEGIKNGTLTKVSGLRSYGSMTYAGFKSYLYAALTPEDPRVKAALGWIGNNWTLEQNPGLTVNEETQSHKQGLFYYYLTMGRALSAYGKPTLQIKDGQTVDWQNELISQLAKLQQEDGSWVNNADRWNEGMPEMVTAFSVIALHNALSLEKQAQITQGEDTASTKDDTSNK